MFKHVFRGPPSPTNPCVKCGAWEDEALDIPCIGEDPLTDAVAAFERDCGEGWVVTIKQAIRPA